MAADMKFSIKFVHKAHLADITAKNCGGNNMRRIRLDKKRTLYLI